MSGAPHGGRGESTTTIGSSRSIGSSLSSRGIEWYAPVLRLAALGAIFLAFTLLTEGRFLDVRNIENILVQSAVVACAAIGATLVILAGQLDLSVGSTLALSVVTVALTLRSLAGALDEWPIAVPLVAALAGVGAALLAGALNGALVAGLRLNPFIATLGTLQVVRGAAKGLCDSRSVYTPESWLNPLLESTLAPGRRWMLLPPGVWLVIALAVIAAIVIRHTVFGRHLVALGSNEEAARLCGLPRRRLKVAVYLAAALLAGVAGVLQYSYIGLGDPTTASGLELYAIAAVVIGGGSLRGGEGGVWGTLCGALIIGVLDAGSVQMGWPSWAQDIVAGAVIIGAVAVDRWRR